MGKVSTESGNYSRDKGKQQGRSIKQKNISKREFDQVKRMKKHQKLEKVKERKALREKEIAIKKAEKKLKKGGTIKKPKDESKANDDADWEDVDEHEKDVFDKDGYFDVPEGDAQISANDEKLLKTLQKRVNESGKARPKENESLNLADMIMQKLASGQYQDGDAQKAPIKYEDLEDGVASSLDPKVVAAYKSLGTVLRQYKSGKIPKIFKIIP